MIHHGIGREVLGQQVPRAGDVDHEVRPDHSQKDELRGDLVAAAGFGEAQFVAPLLQVSDDGVR